MADRTLELTLLFDFFGELLTEKQREYFDLHYNSDLSLSEIGQLYGISRQGVRGVISDAEAAMRRYEEKTGVVARFIDMQNRLEILEKKSAHLAELLAGTEEGALAAEIAAGFPELKG